MKWNRLKTIYKKEILDVLRDKKTVFTMLILPILLYPTLFIITLQIVTFVMSERETTEYTIAFMAGESGQKELMEWIAGDEDGLAYSFRVRKAKEPMEDLKAEKVDVCVEVVPNEERFLYRIHYLSAASKSQTAATYLEEEIDSYRIYRAKQKLAGEGKEIDRYLYPVKSELKDMSSKESVMGNIMGGFVPFLLIVSIVLAVMYPAIDTTTGEHERGTLETMLTLPVNNKELIMGKFFSVATIAVVSVFVNILSIGGIVAYLIVTIREVSPAVVDFKITTFTPAILISTLCVVAFALLMSAVVMCVCAHAKSFKEANNYTTPISLVIIIISYVGFIPNVTLNHLTAILPVANISLLLKNLLVFKYDYPMIAIVLLSNIIYALLAISALAKIYRSEMLLFGDSSSGLKLMERRKNLRPGTVPSLQDCALAIVVALILAVYAGGVAGIHHQVLGLWITELSIVGLPLFTCWYMKADKKQIFLLRKPGGKQLLGTLVLYIGVESFVLILSEILAKYFPDSVNGVSTQMNDVLGKIPCWEAFFMTAVLPAVCEELMYRGFLQTSVTKRTRGWMGIVTGAILFAASHMGLVKMLPLTLLGLAFGYMAYCTQSIFCSMLMHMLNNGLVVLMAYYGERIAWLKDGSLGSIGMIVLGIFTILCVPMGIIILRRSRFYAKIS